MTDAYNPLDDDEDFENEAFDENEENGADGAVEETEGEDDEIQRDPDEDAEASSVAPNGQRSQTSGREERQPSRAQRRVENALREAREAKEEVTRLRAQVSTPQPPQETPAQRQSRLDSMDPWDRTEYLLREQEQRHRNDFGQLQFQMQDSSDRTAFESVCARSPAASKLRNQVEDYLANMRRTGTNAPRETVLKFLIGERALANAGRANGRNQKRAEENTRRQAARPGAGRSDQGGGGERRGGDSESAARRKRLEDQQI